MAQDANAAGSNGQHERRKDGRRQEKKDRRGSVVDRRAGKERRVKETPGFGTERRKGPDRRVESGERRSGLDRRRGPGRRRSEDRRAAEEGEMTDEQMEFLAAMNEYKLVNSRPFPSWTEVLDVVKALGYRKVTGRSGIQ